MKKYLVKLIFNVSVNQGADNSEFDSQMRVIRAFSSEDAFYKAREAGRREEGTVQSPSGQVNWRFIDVCELYDLEELGDGDQVFSETRKYTDSQSYITYIRHRSMELQVKNCSFA
jgi:hypothetical protein